MTNGTVLVLGGSGFVGRHVISRLVRDGKRVVVPTRRIVRGLAMRTSCWDDVEPSQSTRVR